MFPRTSWFKVKFHRGLFLISLINDCLMLLNALSSFISGVVFLQWQYVYSLTSEYINSQDAIKFSIEVHSNHKCHYTDVTVTE